MGHGNVYAPCDTCIFLSRDVIAEQINLSNDQIAELEKRVVELTERVDWLYNEDNEYYDIL